MIKKSWQYLGAQFFSWTLHSGKAYRMEAANFPFLFFPFSRWAIQRDLQLKAKFDQFKSGEWSYPTIRLSQGYCFYIIIRVALTQIHGNSIAKSIMFNKHLMCSLTLMLLELRVRRPFHRSSLVKLANRGRNVLRSNELNPLDGHWQYLIALTYSVTNNKHNAQR